MRDGWENCQAEAASWSVCFTGKLYRQNCQRNKHEELERVNFHRRDLFMAYYSGGNAPFSDASIIYGKDPVDIAQQIAA